MEINKQLFEDVLLGKLKGTFVLPNGDKYDSSKLYRNTTRMKSQNYPYALYVGNYVFSHYISNGKNSTLQVDKYDIIDFIPDADMKENELTVEIPDGKIVDWDESKKQNKIVLKDKQLTYEDICKKLFQPNCIYFITMNGNIGSSVDFDGALASCSNNATTKHQLECLLAKNKLANVAKYLNDGWKPNKGDHVFYLTGYDDFENKVYVGGYYFGEGENLILFKTQKVAQQAIEILGEEIIKLALEPLGI